MIARNIATRRLRQVAAHINLRAEIILPPPPAPRGFNTPLLTINNCRPKAILSLEARGLVNVRIEGTPRGTLVYSHHHHRSLESFARLY